MKKVLVIATRPPFPASAGREMMLKQLLESSPKNIDFIYCYFKKKEDLAADELMAEFNKNKLNVSKVVQLNFPSYAESFLNILKFKYSLQESMFYCRNTMSAICEIFQNEKPDVVYCDMLRTSSYAVNLKAPRKVIDLDDMLSIRYQRFYRQTNDNFDLLGSFGSLLGRPLRKVTNLFLKPILLLESRLISTREKTVLNDFDAVALVSPLEASNLTKREVKKVYALPPMISVSELKWQYKQSAVKKLLFVGNLTTNQNFASIKYIIEKVLPSLSTYDIKFELEIIGKYDHRIESLKREGVHFHGFVESLTDIYTSVDLLLAPIAFGTGIKLKIIEAISYGLPIATNSVGAEGIPINSKNAIIEDDLYCFCQQVSELLRDQNKLNTYSSSALASIEKSFSMSYVKNELTQFLLDENTNY